MDLTKEQIGQLTSEQQEAFATLALQRLNKLQQLRKLAGHSRGLYLLPAVAAAAMLILNLTVFQKDHLLLFAIGTIFGLIQFHVISINRRIDSLLSLFESEFDSSAAKSGNDGKKTDA